MTLPKPLAALTGLLLIAACPSYAAPADDQALAALADGYFDHYYFPTNPTAATLAGMHRYDDQLEDPTRAAVDRQVAQLKDWEARFAAVDPAPLSPQAAGDRELLLSSIRSTLLSLQTVRMWEKNPDNYSSGITGSAFSIMERKFASPNERLKRLIAREKQMPAWFDAARANLRNPPKIYTEVAIEQLPGSIRFFRDDLPRAFADADDAALKAAFAESNAAVIRALGDYQTWLRKELLPRSKGDFRLGEATYRQKLLYDEMVDTPLPQLLRIGMADLRRNQAEFARIAKQVDPKKTPRQVLAELGADHPPPDQLLAAFRATFDGLTKFIADKQIIDLPSEVRPIVEETPPFMRATTFASMDTPGPFETGAQEAYFNVTLPDLAWPKARTEEFMAQFNFPVISNVAVHEAYPGHYIQFLWMHQVEDRVRKLIGASSNAEGWAHYCEQMMLDEGFGAVGLVAKNERESQMLRLGQLQDALLRDARYIVGIRMHTGTMSFDQAVRFFVEEGYQSREVGRIETTRGTADPTYLYYTLGKLQILKLRADLQARQGKDFKLRKFHDELMRQGFPPIKIVRKALLGDDSPTL